MRVPTRRAVTGEYASSRRAIRTVRSSPRSPYPRSTAPAASALMVDAYGNRAPTRCSTSRPLPEPEAIDALDELIERDLVRTTDVPRRLRFRHPLVRGAIYEGTRGGWRLGAHERCAAVLERRGAPASVRAHHVEQAARHGDPAAVAARCQAAAGRHEAAARTARPGRESAATMPLPLYAAVADRTEAAVALEAGRAAEAAKLALRAAEASEHAGIVIHVARTRLLAGRALAAAGEAERAVAELTRAATIYEACGAEPRRAEAERELRKLGLRGAYRRTQPGARHGDALASLTERELEAARLIVDGRTNGEIAAALFPSKKTVESHVRNLFHKLGVSSRVDVARVVERSAERV